MRRELIGGIVLALDAVLSWLIGPNPWPMLGLDLAVLCVLGGLAWKSPRSWPVWSLAAQAVSAAASLAYALQPDVGEATYLRALLLTGAAALAPLVLSLLRPR